MNSHLVIGRFILAVFCFLVTQLANAQTIASFNIRGNDGVLNDKVEFITSFVRSETIEGLNVSLLALQEVVSSELPAMLVERLGSDWRYLITKKKSEHAHEHFAFVYDSFVWTHVEYDYTSNLEAQKHLRKPFVAKFTYKPVGGNYQFINVHSKFGQQTVGPIMDELLKVFSLYKSIVHLASHTIAMGDFNLTVRQITVPERTFPSPTAEDSDRIAALHVMAEEGFLPWRQSDNRDEYTLLNEAGGYHRKLDQILLCRSYERKIIVRRVDFENYPIGGDYSGKSYMELVSNHVPILLHISQEDIEIQNNSIKNSIRGWFNK